MSKDKNWVRNEKIINRDPTLKAARDISQGFKPKQGQTHGGKGSARRGTDDDLYSQGWDRIFGKKDKNND
tara:strand:- start:645 stop:854 length:210 start_codon:yes stop_codon:yes gene_type:complete